jgi:ketosteroid isomerase-like protein
MRSPLVLLAFALLVSPALLPAQGGGHAVLQQQVMAAERAFAKTMADRDHAAFADQLSDEAIFFNGEEPIRGKDAVVAAWKPFYDGPDAPFSWEPDRVEVIESGTLALSTGPVRDPSGKVIGRFNSIWRRDSSGAWRVVFDKGSPVCPPRPASAAPTPGGGPDA